MFQLFRFGLSRWLLLALVAVGIISGILFVQVWVPQFTRLWLEVASRETEQQIAIVADSLTPFMLGNQFAGIYETLDALLERNEHWRQIVLLNEDGRRIYPIFDPAPETGAHLWTTTENLTFRGEPIGQISATVDFSADLTRLNGMAHSLGILAMLLFFLAVGIIGAVVEIFVLRRLRMLGRASSELSRGNYSAVLPPEYSDEVGALSGVFRSMRERIRDKERDLNEARQAAESAASAKAQFLATMSHEIRTPMNGVIPVAEMLASTDLDAHQQRLVNTIQISGQALSSIIDDILDFSRLDAGHVTIRSEPFDLQDLVTGIRDMLATTSETKNIRLHTDVSEQLSGCFAGDGARLRQVLLNLAGNAVKFTEQGHVVIRARRTEDATGAAWIRISVEDTGIGIPADQIERIFDRFSQADNSISRDFGGSGLGLSISRMLVRAMGGDIGVESEVGTGSTFWFTLPLRRAQSEVVQPSAPEAPAEPGALRVLVADDNDINRVVACAMLEQLGHQCVTVDDGQEAVEAVRNEDYDLVLMDVQMPRLDGLAATQAIRALGGALSQIKIVGLSASATNDDSRQCFDAGMDGFLSKPLQRARLEDLLRDHAKV